MASSGGAASPGRDQPHGQGDEWLADFHRGDGAALQACYRQHRAAVDRAVGGLLGAADRETLIHELFSRLIVDEELRRSFGGGSFASWLAAVARHQALDLRRRLGRETPL